MTQRLCDYSRWQAGLDLAKVKAAGFSILNVAIGRGLDPAEAVRVADRARAVGLEVSCYAWLDGRTSGSNQAAIALGAMRELGATAIAWDCEDTNRPAAWTTWRDAVNATQDGIGRPALAYLPAWWAARFAAAWDCASVTPYLMAQPADGKQPAYPGDTSAHWLANWGGYSQLSVMQYQVAPIGGVDCSLSAIRDLDVWVALTGGNMAQSPEYPDLPWGGPAKWFTKGRSYPIRLAVIHYTAGSEGPTSAENGAAYDRVRNESVSTHYFADSNSVVQCVLTKDTAYHARRHGNYIGIGYELCGTAQTRAQWLDAASNPTLTNAARQVARDCKKYGIPVKRLSVAQTRESFYGPNYYKGIVGHVDCTNAFPEDNGTHQDPGTAFPWDIFLARVQQFVDGDDEMSAADAKQGVYDAFAEAATGGDASTAFGRQLREYVRAVTGGPVDGAALLAAIQQNGNVDEAVLAAALAPLLLAGMPAGNLTADQVEQALRNVLTTGTNG